MSLGEEVELVAKKVRIYGETSALELDRDAKVWGDKLKLQPPATPAPERDPERTSPRQNRCRYVSSMTDINRTTGARIN
jgi:hypothetical protein